MASTKTKSQLAFLSTKDREMFPLKMSSDRFGNELCPIRGAPHRGPGCYNNDEKTSICHEVEKNIVSTKGYILGARTASRFAKDQIFKTPCPTEYQQHLCEPKTFKTSKKPFLSGKERFPVYRRELITAVPGAGTYEHDIPRNRKVQWHQSFGEAPVLLPKVTLRSTIDRNTEKLYSTREEKKYQRKLAYLKLYY